MENLIEGIIKLVVDLIWQKSHPEPPFDPTEIVLTQADLTGVDLHSINLSKVKLVKIDLSSADLSWIDFSQSNLTDANLTGANLTGANLNDTVLNGGLFIRADLSKANLTWAKLIGTDLTEANLGEANLDWANLTNANLTNANLSGAILTDAKLDQANLSGATMPDGSIHAQMPRAPEKPSSTGIQQSGISPQPAKQGEPTRSLKPHLVSGAIGAILGLLLCIAFVFATVGKDNEIGEIVSPVLCCLLPAALLVGTPLGLLGGLTGQAFGSYWGNESDKLTFIIVSCAILVGAVSGLTASLLLFAMMMM